MSELNEMNQKYYECCGMPMGTENKLYGNNSAMAEDKASTAATLIQFAI